MVARVTTIEGSRSTATNRPFTAPSRAPRAIEAGSTNSSGQLPAASKPAETLQTANWDPIEISIWRAIMTSATPQVTIRAGASPVIKVSSG